MDSVPAMVKLIGETELEVDFIDPIDAITPGQAIALYDRETGQELIGGAWIVGEERK